MASQHLAFEYGPGEVGEAAQRILTAFPAARVLAFSGELGAGKTTLIQAICGVLGVPGPVLSPTFALVNEYGGPGGARICHFDLYRLSGPEEAARLGLEEYFDTADWCLVEWPDRAAPLLPPGTLHLYLSHAGGARRLEAQLFPHS